ALGNTLVLDALFSYLSSSDILSFGCTSRAARDSRLSYFHRSRDINRRLARFFAKPAVFLSMQLRIGVSITRTGSFDESYRSNALDVVVKRPHFVDFGQFLLDNGYEIRQEGEGIETLETAYRRMRMPIDLERKRLDSF
ncbi:hypothetical protein K488DRAFT_32321, partial [Vararia minispora EC-137]